MRRYSALLLGVALAWAIGLPAHAAKRELLPAGTVFQPPDDSELNFGNDPPSPRQAVDDKDARVVAVIFSVNKVKAMRRAFPDTENIDLLPIAGRPMVAHVIANLKASPNIEHIILVADPVVEYALAIEDDPMVTFLEDQGDATENVKHGIHTIARGDLVILMPSDLPLIPAATIDNLVNHARQYEDIDVFFPLIQRERCTDEVSRRQRFIDFKEGLFTGAHVELVRPALFVDNSEEVEGERNTMYQVYNMRRDALGIVRFLGFRLTMRFIFNNLSPSDVATRVYTKFHVKAQAFLSDDPRLATDVHSPKFLPYFEAALSDSAAPAVATAEAADAGADPT